MRPGATQQRWFTWKKSQPVRTVIPGAAVSECPALSNWEVYAIVHFWPFISDSRASAEYEYLVIGSSTAELFNRILYAKSRAAASFSRRWFTAARRRRRGGRATVSRTAAAGRCRVARRRRSRCCWRRPNCSITNNQLIVETRTSGTASIRNSESCDNLAV